MKTLLRLFIFTVLLLFYSCSGLNYLTINVKKPAQITLPISVENIVIVDNTSSKSNSNKQLSKRNNIMYPTDTLGTIFTEALSQFMDEDAFYNQVFLYDAPTSVNKTGLEDQTMNPDRIKQIIASTQADALISLEKLLLNSELGAINIGDGLTQNTIKATIQASLRVYDTQANPITPVIVYSDSLFWDAISQGSYIITKQLPSHDVVLKEAAVYAASKLVGMFDPYWMEQDRWYYIDGTTQMKRATLKAQNNLWENAIEIWEEIYNIEKSQRKKAKVASNIALAYEMLDNMEKALEWINISYEEFLAIKKMNANDPDILRTISYRNELINRIQDFDNLDMQEGTNIRQ